MKRITIKGQGWGAWWARWTVYIEQYDYLCSKLLLRYFFILAGSLDTQALPLQFTNNNERRDRCSNYHQIIAQQCCCILINIPMQKLFPAWLTYFFRNMLLPIWYRLYIFLNVEKPVRFILRFCTSGGGGGGKIMAWSLVLTCRIFFCSFKFNDHV